MTDTIYDNPSHWKELHVRFPGSLRAVGRSGLSESYNRYKYRSEERTFSAALKKIIFSSRKNDLQVLDIGAGTGYWLNVIRNHAGPSVKDMRYSAMDLSENALETLKKNIPEAICIVANAGTAPPESYSMQYDVVMSNYCLHHITDTAQFNNALQLAVNSVKPGGWLLIMDCLIDRKYSPFYEVDADSYKGSGLSRPLRWVDEACENKNMRRVYMSEPVSFLMNNVLEADSVMGYRSRQLVWKILHRLYKIEWLSRWLMPLVYPFDRFLKSRNKGYSTRLVVYQKQLS
jgi:SAM-dependent methyltransferase